MIEALENCILKDYYRQLKPKIKYLFLCQEHFISSFDTYPSIAFLLHDSYF